MAGDDMKDIVQNIVRQSLDIKQRFFDAHQEAIVTVAEQMAGCITAGYKILFFGNGGSAADAQHLAAEFVNRFQIERPPLAALALTTDTSILTSIGNDYDFRDIFTKQIRALGKKSDMAVGISTSGNSANVIDGIRTAADMGMFTVGLTGPGGKLAACADRVFAVDAVATARIQEVHILLGHVLCELVERILFPEAFSTDGPNL